MPQFNGKQEGIKAMQAMLASAQIFNLRCPRNGKTNELLPGLSAKQDSAFITRH